MRNYAQYGLFAVTAIIMVCLGCEGKITPVSIDPVDLLPAECHEALADSPSWLYDDLADLFTRLDAASQIRYAQVILAAENPDTIDEIAFSIAHLSPEVLTDPDFDEEILVDNAVALYDHDPLLNYVDLVEYGDPVSGGDYYTTARYWIGDPDKDVSAYELDRDDYYWFVVHPEIEDEWPLYINPDTGRVSPPPNGKFWRSYLFNHADPGYPLLSEELAGVDTLWNQRFGTLTDNGAIGVITQWILDCLDFTSGAERPIQPVRIYAIHVGRCGEHADITSAAARAALIPCVNISAIGNDHVWNEFFDGSWHQWEPVNVMIDNFESYDIDDGDGGWWRMYMAMGTRGDGYSWNVTPKYSDTCTVNVSVSDLLGSPVEGSQFSAAMRYGISYFPVLWTLAEGDGTFAIEIGEERSVYARVDSALGGYPEKYLKIVDPTVAGETYSWDVKVEGTKAVVDVTEAALLPASPPGYRVDIDYALPHQICHGTNHLTGQEFSEKFAPGRTLFFICDGFNYKLFSNGLAFQAHEVEHESSSGTVSFTVPYAATWYVVFSNHEQVGATAICDAAITVSKAQGGEWTFADCVTDHMFIPAGKAIAWQIMAFF